MKATNYGELRQAPTFHVKYLDPPVPVIADALRRDDAALNPPLNGSARDPFQFCIFIHSEEIEQTIGFSLPSRL